MTTERDELVRIAEEVARSEGVELYWLEYRQTPGRWLLQVIIDKEGGVTLDDCARVSRALEGPFDERIDRSYVLEVSSPGMDRPLHTEDHFRRAVGRLIRVKTYAPVQGGRVWSGRLLACRDGVLQLETAKGILELPLDGLASARISPEYELL
jgi:ribosome maturation factor RimP